MRYVVKYWRWGIVAAPFGVFGIGLVTNSPSLARWLGALLGHAIDPMLAIASALIGAAMYRRPAALVPAAIAIGIIIELIVVQQGYLHKQFSVTTFATRACAAYYLAVVASLVADVVVANNFGDDATSS